MPLPPWARTILRAAAEARMRLYSRRRNLVFALELSQPPPDLTIRGDVTIRLASPADVRRFSADPAHAISAYAARLQRRLLREGCRCTVALLDGRIVYHGWSARDHWRIAGAYRLPLGPGNAVIFRCLTVPEHRGRAIAVASVLHELIELRREGVSRVFVNIEETNIASLRGTAKLGFQLVGGYEVVWLAGRVSVRMEEALRRAAAATAPA